MSEGALLIGERVYLFNVDIKCTFMNTHAQKHTDALHRKNKVD